MGFGITGESIKGVARAVLSSSQNDTEKARADFVFAGRYVHARTFDAATAGTAQTETVIYHCIATSAVVKVCSVTAPIAVASNGSNFATWNLAKRTGAGGSVAIGTFTTSATSMVAFVPALMTLTAANVTLLQGDVLTLALVKSGTGVATTAATSDGLVEVQIEEST